MTSMASYVQPMEHWTIYLTALAEILKDKTKKTRLKAILICAAWNSTRCHYSEAMLCNKKIKNSIYLTKSKSNLWEHK